MTIQYQGNYSYTLSNNLDANTQKRYIMAVQRGKPILDAELSEIAFSAFTGLRNYIRANFDVSSSADVENQNRATAAERAVAIDNSFKIVESASNVNNFTITGGNGTFEQPAMMFVKGIPAIITGDFDYNQQSAVLPLNDDKRTNTVIPPLTTPVANRTDTVYIDLYFAEVSSEAGSEYQDTSIKDAMIGIQTSNRFRIVQDILVDEGSVLPLVDGNDINGIYHRYIKLATINRLAGDNTITNAMIVDERFVTVALKDLTNGLGRIWVGTLEMTGDLIPNVNDTSNLGSATHRFANLYMASNIDTDGGLTIDHSGAAGQALKIIRSGTSLADLLSVDDLFKVDATGLVLSLNTTESTSFSVGAMTLLGGLGVAKNLNIGGAADITGNLNVNGTITSPNGFGVVHITDTTQSTSKDTGALIVEGGAGIEKDVFIGGSLNVAGDFTVDGTLTTINTTNLNVTDQNITVNKSGDDVSSEGAGLTVERTGPFGSLIYRATAQGKFAIGDIGLETDIVISTRSISVSGNGLSGGGDFSANRTITSNATASNVVSTIVFRDGSGNFASNSVDASTLSARDMTPGSVVFIGAAGGLLTEDNANFFWNDTTNTLCIGASAPDTAGIRLSVKRDDGISNGEHFIGEFFRSGSDAALSFGYRADGASVTGTLIRSGNSQPIFLGTTSSNTAIKITNPGDLIFSSKISSTEAYLNAMLTLEASGTDYVRFQDGASVNVRMTPTLNYFVKNVMIGASATATSALQIAGNTATLTMGYDVAESGPYSITVPGSGGSTPATKGAGFGRDLIISAGNSDNTAALAGGDLYLMPGAPTSPSTVYGDVRLAAAGGNVIVGLNSSPGNELLVASGFLNVENHTAGAVVKIDSAVGQEPTIRFTNANDVASEWTLFKNDSGNGSINVSRAGVNKLAINELITTLTTDLTVNRASDTFVTFMSSTGLSAIVISPNAGSDGYLYIASTWQVGYDASASKFKISYSAFDTLDALAIDDVTGLVTISSVSVSGQGFFRETLSSIDGSTANLGALIVGSPAGNQIQIDFDDIQAVGVGTPTTLYLNYYGGDVNVASAGGVSTFGGPISANSTITATGLITANGGLSIPSGDFTVAGGHITASSGAHAVRGTNGRFDNLFAYLTSQILVNSTTRFVTTNQLQFQDANSIISTTGGGEFHMRSDRLSRFYTTNTNTLSLGVNSGTQLTLANTTLTYSGVSNTFNVSGFTVLSRTLTVNDASTITNGSSAAPALNLNQNDVSYFTSGGRHTYAGLNINRTGDFSDYTGTYNTYGLRVENNAGISNSTITGAGSLSNVGVRSAVYGVESGTATNIIQNIGFMAAVSGGDNPGGRANVAFYSSISGGAAADAYALYSADQGNIYLTNGDITLQDGNLNMHFENSNILEGLIFAQGVMSGGGGQTAGGVGSASTATLKWRMENIVTNGSGQWTGLPSIVNPSRVVAILAVANTAANEWTFDGNVRWNTFTAVVDSMNASQNYKLTIFYT